MPRLTRPTKRIELKGIEGAYVLVNSWMTIGEQTIIQQKYPNLTDPNNPDAIKSSIELLTMSIKEWNLTDDNDEILPITFDNVSQLPLSDIMDIVMSYTPKKKD